MGAATIASRPGSEVKSALARYTSPSSRSFQAARVRPATESLYALPEIKVLLAEELALLPAHAARQPGGRALLLQPVIDTVMDLDAAAAAHERMASNVGFGKIILRV